jgi:hypothetical protein
MGKMSRRWSYLAWFILGAGAGHLLVHPYAMVAYSLMDMYREGRLTIHTGHIFSAARAIFDPVMLPMTISFSLLCGIATLLMGVVRDKKKKLYEASIEDERKKASVETLHRLMVTLSHYLLNANTVIGGAVRHCRRCSSPEEIASSLKVIEDQAHKIDAVIAALRKITDIRTADYTAGGHDLMLDIAKEMEEIVKKKVSARANH